MLYHGISVIIAFKNGEIKEHCTDFCNEIRVDLCEKKELFKSVSDWDGFSDEVFSAFHTPYDDIGDASWDEYAAIPLEDFAYEISSEDVKNIYSVVLITNHDNDWGPRKLDWKKITLNPYDISTGSYELEADVDLDGCEMSYALENIIPEVKNFKKSKSSIKKIKNDDLSDGVFTYFLFDEDNKRCQSMASVDYWVDNDDVCITGYLGEDSCVEIPEYIDGKPVTVIYKISGGKNLKRIHFKNSKNKMHVEPDAFEESVSIEEIIIDEPEKIYFIDGALSKCKNLVSDGFVVAGGVLADDLNKNDRKVLTIPEGVKKISYGIYKDCKNIVEIVFPSSLLCVNGFEFNNFTALKKIIINGKTEIDTYSFLGCTNLEEVVVNGEVSFNFKTGCKAFKDSEELIKKDKFCIIGKTLVNYNGDEEECIIPESVEVIGPYAFKTGDFSSNTKLKKVELPENLRVIGNNAFRGCGNLERINFPDALISIESDAFHGCGFKKIKFNNNLKLIGRSAFAYCNNLSEVIISPETVCEEEAFSGCNNDLAREDGLIAFNGVAFDYNYKKNSDFYNTPEEITRIVIANDVQAISNYFFNSPGDTLDELVMTNAVKKISTNAFFLSGIKLLKILDSVTGETVFETTDFKGKSNTLLCNSGKFERFCELIEKDDYETIRAEFGKKTTIKKKQPTAKKGEKAVVATAKTEPSPVWVDPFPEDADVDDFDAQFRKEWLEKYGEHLTENPKIEIKDKIFAFSGLSVLPMSEAEKEEPIVLEVLSRGGQYRSKVSGLTNYLIVNPVFAGDSKMKAVIEQRKKGKNIQVILLEDFEKYLNGQLLPAVTKKSETPVKKTTAKKEVLLATSTKVQKVSFENYSFPKYEVKDSRKKFLKKSTGTRIPVHTHGCDIKLKKMYSEYLTPEEIEFAELIENIYLTEEKKELKHKLENKALEIAEFFAVNESEFDAENDKAAMIKNGYIKAIYQLHALRSFAWTLSKWVKENKKEIKAVTIDELMALADFIEKAGGANYNASTVSDTAFCASIRPKHEFGKVYAGVSGMVVPGVVSSEGGPISIYALRKDLDVLAPAIDTMLEYYSAKKQDGGFTESTLTDILFAWAVFAFASCEPFKVLQGPETVTLTNDVELAEEIAVNTVKPDENGFYIHDGILLAIEKKKCNTDNLIIPDGVERILSGGPKLSCIVYDEHPDFCFLQDVKSLTIPGTMKYSGSFADCKMLKEITFENGVEKISNGAFWNNKSIEKIHLPETVKEIGPSAFCYCEKLKSITIPKSVEVIGEESFSSCVELEDVNVLSAVTIDKHAFRWCRNLKNIVFWEAVEEIGEEAFSGCDNLEKIVFKSSLKRIGKGAFQYCHNIKRITIPASVVEIGEEAFNSVYGLEGPDSWHYKYGGAKFDFVFEVYKDSYAEKYAKAKGWYHNVILTEEQKLENIRLVREERLRKEALRRAEQERIAEARRQEELRKRREEEERRRSEAEERAKRVACYRGLLEEEKILLQTIEENKGIFGEKAKKRKAAKQRLEEVRTELEKYKDLY